MLIIRKLIVIVGLWGILCNSAYSGGINEKQNKLNPLEQELLSIIAHSKPFRNKSEQEAGNSFIKKKLDPNDVTIKEDLCDLAIFSARSGKKEALHWYDLGSCITEELANHIVIKFPDYAYEDVIWKVMLQDTWRRIINSTNQLKNTQQNKEDYCIRAAMYDFMGWKERFEIDFEKCKLLTNGKDIYKENKDKMEEKLSNVLEALKQ